MTKMPDEVAKRLFENVYVCMRCNAKIRASSAKIKAGKVKCRRCGYKKFRLKAKEKKGGAK